MLEKRISWICLWREIDEVLDLERIVASLLGPGGVSSIINQQCRIGAVIADAECRSFIFQGERRGGDSSFWHGNILEMHLG